MHDIKKMLPYIREWNNCDPDSRRRSMGTGSGGFVMGPRDRTGEIVECVVQPETSTEPGTIDVSLTTQGIFDFFLATRDPVGFLQEDGVNVGLCARVQNGTYPILCFGVPLTTVTISLINMEPGYMDDNPYVAKCIGELWLDGLTYCGDFNGTGEHLDILSHSTTLRCYDVYLVTSDIMYGDICIIDEPVALILQYK